MGILGIKNRTEDWKTAMTFAPFFKSDSARTRLANWLLKPLGENHEVQPGTVKIELFWYGMRDYVHNEEDKDFATLSTVFTERYDNCGFRDLGKRIEGAKGLSLSLPKKSLNYKPEGNETNLYNNLCNTEIDIVLETSKYLFIGEAKHESDLGTNGELVLVHQLIRQYVMAKILVDLRESDGCPGKEVIPFIVADKESNIKDKHQVRFMRDHECWLNEKNILSWDCIRKIAESVPIAS